MLRLVGSAADGWVPSLPRLPLAEVPQRQAAIDEAAMAAGRDPAAIARMANVNGAIVDGDVTGWLHGPVEHWVEELTKLVTELRFDGLVLWADHDDPLGQTERFATEVVPRVRDAIVA
jgi:alkanesulfonate monooxygenase SsuD/methylene tetrahydromethanopterin reductase-like flavin-dependent oxidoreductase (luciferase family)